MYSFNLRDGSLSLTRGHGCLTTVPGSVGGQHRYESKVTLQYDVPVEKKILTLYKIL